MEISNIRLKKIKTREHALLFQDWFLLLAKGRLEIASQGLSGESWTFNTADKKIIKITFLPDTEILDIQTSSEILNVVEKISNESLFKIETNCPTPGGWWSISFASQHNGMDQHSLLHMIRNLATFKRGSGKLRLGRSALLEIEDETGEQPGLFPKLSIKVSIFTLGAASGPYSRMEAEKRIPTIGAVLSSCFGTPLTPSPSLFPVKEEKFSELVKGVKSNEIHELGFEGLPIWSVLGNIQFSGAGELANRLVGAMMAYEAGMLQKTDHSTLFFFVSAIEALTVPNLKAAKPQRVSKRFCYFLDEFCSTVMDVIMAHSNFKQGFGRINSRYNFAAELYKLRSQPAHTGHFGNYSEMMLGAQSMKVGLVNKLVREAIAALVKQPVSLLWGHPGLDPSFTIKLEPDENQKLKKKARNHNKKVDEYLKSLVLKNIN